jgi:hypothetical protein
MVLLSNKESKQFENLYNKRERKKERKKEIKYFNNISYFTKIIKKKIKSSQTKLKFTEEN